MLLKEEKTSSETIRYPKQSAVSSQERRTIIFSNVNMKYFDLQICLDYEASPLNYYRV